MTCRDGLAEPRVAGCPIGQPACAHVECQGYGLNHDNLFPEEEHSFLNSKNYRGAEGVEWRVERRGLGDWCIFS